MRTGAPGTPFFHHGYGSSSGGTGGLVVVGVVGKNEEDLSQLLDRILDQRVFGGISGHFSTNSGAYGSRLDAFGRIPVPGSGRAEATAASRYGSWMKNRLRHYCDEERGILFVLFPCGSLPVELLAEEDFSVMGLASLLEQHEMFGVRGLFFMFSVCHVVLLVQEGAKFDPRLLRLFRVLQAAKAAIKMPLKGAQARGFYTGSSPVRGGRQASGFSLMSGLSHGLFPGQCTPVLLIVCIDDFSEFETSDATVRQSKLSTGVRQVGKLEQGTRRKFQSSVEAQVRFLVKKSRTILGFGDSGLGGGMGLRGSGNVMGAVPGGGGGPALFTMDPSRVVLFVDRFSNRCCDALEGTITILENMIKGIPNAEGALWENTSGVTEDIQAVRDFIWRQAEIVRGRGGTQAMSVGVGMVAAAAAAAAASAAAGSMGGALRPISNPPELPTLQSWLAASNTILSSLLKFEGKVEVSRRQSCPGSGVDASAGSGLRLFSEADLACIDLACADTNTKFSASWCKKAMPSARGVYLKGLPPCYPTAVHKHQLDKAIGAFRSMVRGPAVNVFLEKLKRECEALWKSGRQLCDAVSLTGRPCTHQVPENAEKEEVQRPHSSGYVFLSACACGRSRRLREDPFDFDSANVSFFRFPNCEDLLPSVVLPHHSKASEGSAWSILRLGNAKYYQPSAGLLQAGFCADQNYLSHYDMSLHYKSAAEPEKTLEGSKISKSSSDQGTVSKKHSEDLKFKPAEKQKNADVKLDYNEESAFPPLPQKNGPKPTKQTPKKAPVKAMESKTNKSEQPKEMVENGGSPLKTIAADAGGARATKEATDVGLYIGFEHECPHGHRFFLSVEHLQKLSPPYSQQAGVEKKARRNKLRGNRAAHLDRTVPARTSDRLQDGVSGSLIEFNAAMENLSVAEAGGDGRVLLNSDLPIYMECPHCKANSNKESDLNYAGTVSRLQRIFLVTPPFPLLMASCPVVQFDETSTPNAKCAMRFSFNCEVVLPPDSFLSLRLPFVYCTENEDGSLLPLQYKEDHPELSAWLVKGTVFYVLSGRQ
ncbi:protein SMG8 isoform X1 [Selaginella moellendorffii]|uniref:protein SMG8 isoform X1 n=1 Tax=Selaginella moellendorffii TaxID=88036 RepID=UPI000D1D087B|nr:protein SMG8 isoform X1 [Selaginella moellendorffii]XP_024545139.1 protein SMG8 isoform X1 [Selaginella moellendorffii]|eukprot:XP_024545138.1 protein SMG8 isoform X1 [Selaginella moellendorffii]